MKIEIDEFRNIVLKEVYSGLLLETSEGNQLSICMRDDTFEINVLPKGSKRYCWQRVDMKTLEIRPLVNNCTNQEKRPLASNGGEEKRTNDLS